MSFQVRHSADWLTAAAGDGNSSSRPHPAGARLERETALWIVLPSHESDLGNVHIRPIKSGLLENGRKSDFKA
jgi:hypothetical protein